MGGYDEQETLNKCHTDDLCFLSFFFLTCSSSASPFLVDYSKEVTLGFGGTTGNGSEWYMVNLGTRAKNATSITAKSSNEKVVQVNAQNNYVQLGTQKKGKATVTITVTKGGTVKNYKMAVTVVKYTNPVKTFKVGSVNYAKDFKKLLQRHNTLIPTKKATVTVKANSGWKIKNIVFSCVMGNQSQSATIKNKSSFDFSKYSSAWHKSIIVELYNKTTKLTSCIYLTEY